MTSPLSCFAISLLAIEGMIALVAVFSKMGPAQQFYCVLIMAALVVALILAGGLIAWNQPRRVSDEATQTEARAALQRVADLEAILNSGDFARLLDDTVEGVLKERQLQITAPKSRGR